MLLIFPLLYLITALIQLQTVCSDDGKTFRNSTGSSGTFERPLGFGTLVTTN